MAGFKYVPGRDGEQHVQKVQFFRVKSVNNKTITIHLAGKHGGRFNNFGFKHILFPSKKAVPTPLAQKALNKAERRADTDAAGIANQYRSGWARQAWGQPSREHEDDTHGEGVTKYGKKIGASTINTYLDTTQLPFDEALVAFAKGCDGAFKGETGKDAQKDVEFVFRTAAVCGVAADGTTAAPSTRMKVTVIRTAQDAYQLLHLVA